MSKKVRKVQHGGSPTSLPVLQPPDTELVIGVVAAVGTNLDDFEEATRDYLKRFRYALEVLRLSSFLKRFGLPELGALNDDTGEAARLSAYMNAGNKVRQLSGRNDFLAMYAASQISRRRRSEGPSSRTAYLLRSLKHPEEVRMLRRIYGSGFFLMALYATEEERLRYLSQEKNCSTEEARGLVERDQKERDDWGQDTRGTFALADAFIRHDPNKPSAMKEQLRRVLDILFGHPHQTPIPDEYAMFLAFSAALRSGDLSRQVGAVVTSPFGDIIGTGANDTPRMGGGLYWPGPDDQRDHRRGHDSNEQRRNDIVIEVIRRLRQLPEPLDNLQREELLMEGKSLLKGSPLLDITEYGRAVHAEMEALLCCARSGVSPRGGTLYTTTFPCHNCAKHIIAAGIKRVVYVEPYPKSLALQLHPDAIAIDSDGKDEKVQFQPFIGIGPRRFFDLFSMELGSGYPLKRKEGGTATAWLHSRANSRISMLPTSYLEREKLVTAELHTLADRIHEGLETTGH